MKPTTEELRQSQRDAELGIENEVARVWCAGYSLHSLRALRQHDHYHAVTHSQRAARRQAVEQRIRQLEGQHGPHTGPAEPVGEVIDRTVDSVLTDLGLPIKPCGLNADWCVSAWHLSKGTPNITDGDYYLLDTEEKSDDDDSWLFEIVTRRYTADAPDGDGNDTITRIFGPKPIGPVAEYLKTRAFYNPAGLAFSPVADDKSERPDPNDCAECARSHGPHYSGPCEHTCADCDQLLACDKHPEASFNPVPFVIIESVEDIEQAARIAASIKQDLHEILFQPIAGAMTVSMSVAYELQANARHITSFSLLHDYLDANTLGDEDLYPDFGEGYSNVQHACDVLNAAQGEVDRWIKAGGLML